MNAAIKSERMLAGSPVRTIGDQPLLLEVQRDGTTATAWATRYAQEVAAFLDEHGALLIRGLTIPGSEQFGRVLKTLFGSELLEYTYRSTPRTALRGNVYTATEYPAAEVIPQHNENAYARSWPNRIGFLCMLPAQRGGETPIGDSRVVYRSIAPEIRDKFERRGVRYVRNYSILDLPWTTVFQTEDRLQVEQYCLENELSWEWIGQDGLRTVQVNPATALHPRSGETLWFNQAHLFHVSALGAERATTLIESFGEEALPRNAYYGDGSPIEPQALDAIRSCYERTKIKFTWQQNDLLLLDNMLYTHGRESFDGPRKVITGMACLQSRSAGRR